MFRSLRNILDKRYLNSNNYQSGFTGSESIELLQEACEYLNPSFGKIILDQNRTIDNYTTEVHGKSRRRGESEISYNFYIGVREFVENPRKQFSNSEVISTVVGMFHEVCGHGSQAVYDFQTDSALSSTLVLNYP